jgi:hypothetical protein
MDFYTQNSQTSQATPQGDNHAWHYGVPVLVAGDAMISASVSGVVGEGDAFGFSDGHHILGVRFGYYPRSDTAATLYTAIIPVEQARIDATQTITADITGLDNGTSYTVWAQGVY